MAAPTSVEEYLAALPADSRTALEHLRAMIRAAAPGATEAISYGMPAFRDRGRMLVYYAAFKAHCSLFPASMAAIEANREGLKGFYAVKGTIRFSPDKPLPAALVRKIVEARLAENAARSGR